jgi:hypothetical protein
VAASWLTELERRAPDDPAGVAAALAFVAGREIGLDEPALRGATRRAVFVLAAGGDPHRPLSFDDRAVETLAADLSSRAQTARLEGRLADLAGEAEGLVHVAAVLAELREDAALAWRALACALLTEEVDGDE